MRRMRPAGNNEIRVNEISISGCFLTFQHQLKRQRAAAHDLWRETKQPLNVSHRAIRRRVDNNHAAAIAATASNNHFDCTRFKNGACSVGGRRRLLHLEGLIVTTTAAPREGGKV